MGQHADDAIDRALKEEADRAMYGDEEMQEFAGMPIFRGIRNREQKSTHPFDPRTFPDLSDWDWTNN